MTYKIIDQAWISEDFENNSSVSFEDLQNEAEVWQEEIEIDENGNIVNQDGKEIARKNYR